MFCGSARICSWLIPCDHVNEVVRIRWCEVDGASDGLFRVGRILAGLDDRRALRVMSEAHDGDIPSLL
jgi:hypothetical protein